jgi:glucose/arabinose dehydrogenase
MRHLLVWLGLAGLLAAQAAAQDRVDSEQARFRVVEVAGGLEHPWGMAFLPDGRILVSERPGRLRLVAPDGTVSPPVAGVPEAAAVGQGGMLDVELGPDHARTGWIYLTLAGRGEGRLGTQVWRGRLDGERWVDSQMLFDMTRKTGSGFHFGSRIAFGGDGLLYFSIGDRGAMERAQDPADEAGRIHRIAPDGTIPADNPFLGEAGAPPSAFTRGNRNPQGMAVHPDTGEIWIHEHGPRGGDEVNLIRAGLNYGWPEATHGIDYSGAVISERESAPGFEDPLHVWVPSIAPSGMTFYTGAAFPGWQGDIFLGALRDRMLVRLELEDGRILAEERMLERAVGRVRDVQQGPDGLLYLLTDADDGRLLRLEPAD